MSSRHASSLRLSTLALVALVGAVAACSKLTEPPKPEPVQDTAAAEAKGAPPPSTAAPTATNRPQPIREALALLDAGPPKDEKLVVKDVVVGTGAEAKAGDGVKVHYVGTLENGTEFDASKKHGKPFDFELGAGRVIKGWDQGVAGMKVGGKRKLVIPPSLGYGARGAPPVIPPNSTLNFEVELLEVTTKK